MKMSHQKKEDPEKRATQSDGSGLVSRTHGFYFKAHYKTLGHAGPFESRYI